MNVNKKQSRILANENMAVCIQVRLWLYRPPDPSNLQPVNLSHDIIKGNNIKNVQSEYKVHLNSTSVNYINVQGVIQDCKTLTTEPGLYH